MKFQILLPLTMESSVLHLRCYLIQVIMCLLHNASGMVTTTTATTSTTKKPNYDEILTNDMITGLLAGFGCFAGFIILVVLFWCFFCGNLCATDDKKRKVGPSPPPWRARMLASQSGSNSTTPSISTRSTRRPQS